MKKIVLLLALFLSIATFSQQKAFEITNKLNGTVKVIDENERVKLRTVDGAKYVGELHFAENGDIQINNETIKIENIKSIKKQPKVLGTVKNIVLYTGLAVVGTSLVVAAGGGNAAFLLFTAGSGICITAGILDAVNAKSTIARNDFKVIEK